MDRPRGIIVGHTNMDLDCLGSLVLARKLYPGYRAVASSRIHAVARSLYTFYKDHLDLDPPSALSDGRVGHLVVVDTRSYGRVKEYLQRLDPPPGEIDVYDHHPGDASDIPGARIHEGSAGANTTLLGMEVMARGMEVSPEEATIALTGIYADTGSFTHENVAPDDFSAARFLMEQGASLTLVKTFLQTLKGEPQISLFHELLKRVVYRTVHGHLIIFGYMEMECQTGGLAAVVEKVFEVENPDAIFAVFPFTREKDVLIVARCRKGMMDLGRFLAAFEGGGHSQASSALVKDAEGRKTFRALEAYLEVCLGRAPTAQDIMTRDVAAILDSWSLRKASLFLENADRTGAPVLDAGGRMCGFLSLRDVMKARREEDMEAPVRRYMIRTVVTGKRETTLREIEDLFFSHTIYYLPIVEHGVVIGIVTRTDYLRARAGGSSGLRPD